MKNHTRKGFTLVELIVVLVIMVVLAAAAIPRIMGYIEESRRSTFIDISSAIYDSVDSYYIDQYANIETDDASFFSNLKNTLPFFSTLSEDEKQKIAGNYSLNGYTLNAIYLYFDNLNSGSFFLYDESLSSHTITKYVMCYVKGQENIYYVICIPGKGVRVTGPTYADCMNYYSENINTEWCFSWE